MNLDPRILELFEFRPRKGDLKKLEIIQASIDCLCEEGLENTTYEAIAKRLNTRRAHIAYHFGDKNQIFISVVKYILGTYQQTLLDALEEVKDSEDGHELLEVYVHAAFDWALKEPKQLQCMLLLYYLCTLNSDYLDLHHQVRHGGWERLSYLFQKKSLRLTKAEARFRAKLLQNALSGALMDSVTTRDQGLDKARTQVLKLLTALCDPKQFV